MAEVLIKYKADAGDLEATVNKINEVNNEAVKSAQKASDKIATDFKNVGKSIAAAFSGNEVKKALAEQNKAFDDLNKKGVPLTRVLRGLKNELNQLEESGQGGTEAFRKLTAEAARLEDQIGDTRARVSNLASDTFKFDAAVQATQGLAAGFEIAQGAAALFGTENEDLQQTIAKTTAAIAIANGLQQISALLLEESKIKTFALAAAQTAYNGVIALTTGALKGLRLALAATGVGTLIVALGALVAYWDDIKTAITGVSEAQRDLNATSEKVLKVEQDKLAAIGDQDEVLKLQGKTEREILNLKVKQSEQTLIAQQTAIKNAQTTLKLQIEAETKSFQTLRNIARFAIEVNLAVLRVIAAPLDLLISTANEISEALGFEKISSTINEQLSKLAATGAETISKLVFDPQETKASGEAALQESEKALKDLQNQRAGFLNSIKDLDQKAADDAAAKAKEAADKADALAKKSAEDQKAARLALLASEREAFISSLDQREKILNDSNDKIAELEKNFRAANFKEGSDEQIQAQNALNDTIAQIKTTANNQIAEIDKKALEDRLAKEAELRRAAAESSLNTQINLTKQLEIEQGSSLERRIQLINLEAEGRKLAATNSIKDEKERASAIELINAESQKAIREEQKKTRDEQINNALEIAEQTAELFSGLLDLSKEQSQARIEEINQQTEAEIEAINQSSQSEVDKQRQREAAQLRSSRKIATEKLKQAKLDRAAALFEIGINTAIAVSKSIAESPTTFGLPFSAFAVAQGLIQAGLVLSKPLPKYKRGGIVGGRSHEAGGTIIEAERGEFVVNRNAVSRHRSELDALNTSSAAFKRLIDERYVRPALNYYMGKKERAINVNASLNSKSMEREIKGMRRDLKRNKTIVNFNGNDSRYAWHLN
jgi:hypothetical protein